MMDILNQIAAFLGQNWELIGFAFTALGLSAALQKFKKKLSITNPKVLLGITSTLSFLTAAIPAMLGWLSANPEVLGAYSAFTFTLMTLLYRYIVQPASSFMTDVKDYKAAQKAAQGSLQAEVDVRVTPVVFPNITPTEPSTHPKEFDV